MLHDQLALEGLLMAGRAFKPFAANDILIVVIEAFHCHPQAATHQSYYIAHFEGFLCHCSIRFEIPRALLSLFLLPFSITSGGLAGIFGLAAVSLWYVGGFVRCWLGGTRSVRERTDVKFPEN
jgi:hypothetical protein